MPPGHVKGYILMYQGYILVYQESEKDVNKVVDEDNVVDKKLNEGSQLEDMVIINALKRFLLETA